MIHYEPHAKINLGLLIKGRREDGYHEIESLMYPFFEMRDDLKLELSVGFGCRINMEGIELDGRKVDNLCVKAYQALRDEVGSLPGVEITLEKKIPAGAGLGGGSSDAAHTLLGLNKLCELELSREKLEEIGAKLGADVPFFLWQQPMLVSGTGTELEPFDLEADFSIKLITPPIHSSTAEAYKALDLEMCSRTLSIEELLGLPRSDWKEFLVNDLEEPVFKLFPELNKIKNELYEEGAFYAAMSGSGSSVFGLFSN